MEQQIANLIIDYSVKEKIADKQFINDLIDILNGSFPIKGRVNNIFTSLYGIESMTGTIAGFDNKTKSIVIDLEIHQSYLDYLSCCEKYFLVNLFTATNFYHELLHADQAYRMKNSDLTIETMIYMQNYDYIDTLWQNKKRKMFYSLYLYNISPIERMANIETYQLIKNLINLIESKYNSLKLSNDKLFPPFLINQKYSRLGIFSPTEKFIKLTDPTFWKQLPFYDKEKKILLQNLKEMLTMQEIMRLGLPISKQDQKLILRK